jgi:hypothetical protein
MDNRGQDYMVELAGMEAPLGNQVIRTEQGQKKKAF